MFKKFLCYMWGHVWSKKPILFFLHFKPFPNVDPHPCRETYCYNSTPLEVAYKTCKYCTSIKHVKCE